MGTRAFAVNFGLFSSLRRMIVVGVLVLLPTAGFAIPAFPGAEGWAGNASSGPAVNTPGGRGTNPIVTKPKVFVVKNLNTAGAGSFNEALHASGPRFIVFQVSGVIDVQPSGSLWWYLGNGNTSYVTVAGQTSPGGITLTGGSSGFSIIFSYKSNFHDGIFRFLRFRAQSHNNDALTMGNAHHFVLDHCDFSGGSDETLDCSDSHNWTVQWCTINNSSACSDCQNYGFLISNYDATNGYNFSIHHNILAHHINRFPHAHWNGHVPPDNGMLDYRNNICYNGRDYFVMIPDFGPVAPKSVHINFMGNTFKAGPQSPPNAEPADWFFHMNSFDPFLYGYEQDNIMIPRSGPSNTTIVGERFANLSPTPFSVPPVTTQSAAAAYELVLNKAGAWPRDAMNTRTIGEIRNGTGQFGKTDDAEITTGPAAPADADNDGMPDFWEIGMGLNPADPSDAVLDKDGNGYLNIEEYINDLALARLCEDYKNPVYPIPSNWSDYNPSCCRPLGVEAGSVAVFGGANLLLAPSVRPGSGAIRIKLWGHGFSSQGRISIVDLRGRVQAEFPAAPEVAWNGLNVKGIRLSAGLYIVRWIEGQRLLARKTLTLI